MAIESAVVKEEHKQTKNAPVLRPIERRIVFISHANPEDNPAAAWFATRLTLLGYEVWCDVKNTHGGESDLWLKIQKVIEERAAKFVFILSNASCDFERKKGIYKEVQTADNLRIDNFILPVRIEPLARALPILVNTSQYINGENWAKALHEIVLRLRKDGVPRNEAIDYRKISSWWPAITAEQQILRTAQEETEEIVSNVFDILSFPARIHFIRVLRGETPVAGLGDLRKALQSQAAFYAHGEHAISFADLADFDGTDGDIGLQLADAIDTGQFLDGGHPGVGISPEIARNIVTHLVGRSQTRHSRCWNSYPPTLQRHKIVSTRHEACPARYCPKGFRTQSLSLDNWLYASTQHVSRLERPQSTRYRNLQRRG